MATVEDRVSTATYLVAARFVVGMISCDSWPGVTTNDDDLRGAALREQLPGLSGRDHTRTLPFHREIKARERAHSGEIPAGHSRAIT